MRYLFLNLINVFTKVKIITLSLFWIVLQNNQFTFERAKCELNPESGILSSAFCDMKRISRKNHYMNFQVNVSKPVYSLWSHIVLYKQFSANVYRPFLVSLREDICGWLNGTAKNHLFDFAVAPMFKHANTKTNMNHKCPFVGFHYIKNDNFSLDILVLEQLMPSGRFRADISFSSARQSPWIARGSIHFSISDVRVEVFWTFQGDLIKIIDMLSDVYTQLHIHSNALWLICYM